MLYDLHASDVTLFASDGVVARLSPVTLKGKQALRLDYQFKGAGHTLIRVPVSLQLSTNYVFRFAVKGTAPANTLEFKCVDPSGENVWWVNRPSFPVKNDWQTLVNKRRHFTYAWGPVNAPLKDVAFIELTVSATAGGVGTVYFADLSYEELADDNSLLPPITARTSSNKGGASLIRTAPGQSETNGWRSSGSERQYLYLDFGTVREFDGLTVDFGRHYAVDYDVQLPHKSGWRTVDRITGGARRRQYHALPESEASAMRLVFSRSAQGQGYNVKAIDLKPIGFASTTTAFFANVAGDLPKGLSPRYFQKEQSFWTVVGVSGGREKAIINEEGLIEPALQAPVLEPFIRTEGKLLTWADGSHSQSLVKGYLPMPVVKRTHEDQGLELTVETLADGHGDRSTLYVRYTVKNRSTVRQEGDLCIALRHYQVNPPWQFLNFPGGFTPVYKLQAEDDLSSVVINDKQRIVALTAPDSFAASTLAAGEIVEKLAAGATSAQGESTVEDSRGYCSGVLQYGFKLAAGAKKSIVLAVPYTEDSQVKPFARARATSIAAWERTLRNVDIDLPAYPQLVDTIKSQLAYILINRDGQALQPGSRCYRRTWIRDGSLTSEALLQLGREADVRRFIEWFAPFQYEDGKVPCCVDKRGADPTPEHDSHGEFIYLVVEYYRYSKDREFLRRLFPRIEAAVGYIDRLRSQRLSASYKEGENSNLYGLLPESISHEGYSAKPAHSYWDDLFALKGLGDAYFAARELADDSDAKSLAAVTFVGTIYDAFKTDLVASMKASMARWKIDYIPGAADRGDFDATSTTIALDPCDLSAELGAELKSTFDAYWRFFSKRRDNAINWNDYTPYEWRVVGTFAKMGQIERAQEAMAFFMKDRRPQGWNHWAEVVFKNPLTPRFIGDAPHGWVGSDFLRAVRTLFVYEKNDSLALASGLPYKWLKQGLTLRNLNTEYGKISLSVESSKEEANVLTYRIDGDVKVPVELSVPVRANGDSERRTFVVQFFPAVVEVSLY